jgi:hypothetical protein
LLAGTNFVEKILELTIEEAFWNTARKKLKHVFFFIYRNKAP